MARCPECNDKLIISTELERWEHIFCNSCGIELEVADVNPLELEAVYDFEDDDNALDELEEEEDDLEWDDDDDDDDDDEW